MRLKSIFYNQSRRRLFMDEDKTFSDNFSRILIFLLWTALKAYHHAVFLEKKVNSHIKQALCEF